MPCMACWRHFCLSASLILIIIANSALLGSGLRPSFTSPEKLSHNKVLKTLWSTPLALRTPDADQILRSGFKYEVQGRNWRRLSLKLATRGSQVKVAVFGGSVTVGHYKSCDNSSWAEEAVKWLEAAFPAVAITLLNLGHAATTATVASYCYYQTMPADVDLVLIEYSANGCGVLQCIRPSQPEVAGYESLLRNIISRAPQAALMTFAVFTWRWDAPAADKEGVHLPAVQNAYFSTGEDQHGIIAKRYNIPMVSVRDALYDVMYDDAVSLAKLGMTRAELMKPDGGVPDTIHPSLLGSQLYGAGLLAWGIRHLVTRALLHSTHHHQHPHLSQHSRQFGRNSSSSSSSGNDQFSGEVLWQQQQQPASAFTDEQHLATPPLPPHICPAAAFRPDPQPGHDLFCAAGVNLQARTVSNMGWEWVDEGRSNCKVPGCHKYGWVSREVGAAIDFEIDSTRILSAQQAAAGVKIALVIVYLKSHMYNPKHSFGPDKGMGTVSVTCVSGCSCTPLKIDAVNRDMTSELDVSQTEVSAHPQCVVRVTILEESSSGGGHKFRLNGVALAPYTGAVPVMRGLSNRLLVDKEHLLATERLVA